MIKKERREFPRIYALNLINYVCLDTRGKLINQGMGRTLNISEAGILIETRSVIINDGTVLITIGLKNEMLEIECKIIYSTLNQGQKMFESGLQFINISIEDLNIIKKYQQIFEHDNKNLNGI